MLATNLATNRVEARRRSSFDALRGIEQWVLDHGFLELVVLRNRFARALGYDNFFDLKVQKTERLETTALMRILDDFVKRTDRSQHPRARRASPAARGRRHRTLESPLLCLR